MNKIILTLLLAAFAGNTLAANINIGPNGCSLADAIRSANNDSAVGSCASGSGSDFIIAPDGWVVTLNSNLPTITSNMTIRSASPAGIFTIDGNNERRVLKITGSNTDVTLLRVKIRDGWIDPFDFNDEGAGILINDATVNLESSSVVSNDVGGHPGNGAIYVDHGDLTIDRSTVEGNVNGDNIYADNSSVHIVDSVFRQNSKGMWFRFNSSLTIESSLFVQTRRAILVDESTVAIVNSTFTSSAPFLDPYILAFRTATGVTLNHVTISEPAGFLDGSLTSVSNSLIADCELGSGANIVLNTGNLYQSTAGGSQNCLGLSPNDYSLLPLADNGGPTQTRAIGNPGSLAIGSGNPTYCEPADQRGEARAAMCDVGAYEATGEADVAITASIEPGAPYVSDQHIIVYAEIENNGPGPATNVQFNIDPDFAFITSVNSAFCNAIPCVITSIQPGQTLVIPVEMTLASYFNSPFSMDLTAHTTASSTHQDADENSPTGNNLFNLTHVINQGADLSLTMDLLTSGPYFVGQTVQYQARIDNFGPQTATGTQLQFAPDNLGSVAFSGCASVSGLTCNVSNIASGGSRTVSIQATISGDQFNAAASVSATQVDINTYNNVDSWSNGGGISNSDIAVLAHSLDPGTTYSYEYIRFEIIIGAGSNPASNIRLDYDFPGAELIDIQQCSSYPCVIPQLAANSEIILLAQFFAPVAVPGVIDTLNFRVLVTPGQEDPDPSNNEDVVVQSLLPTADIAAQLTLVSTPPFYAGQEIQYALRVPNSGVNSATSVNVSVNPQNLSLLSAFGDLCPTVNCTINQLNAFDEENITLVYQIDSVGAFDLTATANANEFDSNTSNNTDSSNNGGNAVEAPNSDRIFADGFE